MIMPLSMLFYGKKSKHIAPYMGGMTTEGEMRYAGSMGISRELVLSNYYLEKMFGEERVFMIGALLCWALLLIAGILLVGAVL